MKDNNCHDLQTMRLREGNVLSIASLFQLYSGFISEKHVQFLDYSPYPYLVEPFPLRLL